MGMRVQVTFPHSDEFYSLLCRINAFNSESKEKDVYFAEKGGSFVAVAAIWGAGNIAHTHAEALRGNGIAIGAVVDVDRAKARAFAEKWDVPASSDDAAVLFARDIDCVHVCAPPALHENMVATLLEKNKHVVCEKPLCLDSAGARKLAALAAERGRVCAVNFNVRFHQACQRARAVAQSPDFGAPLLIHGSYLQEFHALPAPLDWRYNPAVAGTMRAVTEIGSHWMDLAQFISGQKIVAVSACLGRFHPRRYQEGDTMYAAPASGRRPLEVESEDAAAIIFRFSGGAIGSATLSEVSHGRYNRLSLEVTGEKQSLWWNSEENNHLHLAEKGGEIRSRVYAFGGGFADTFRALVAAVYRDVDAGAPSKDSVYPTAAEASYNVQLCNAVQKSAETDGIWIKVEEMQ